MATIKVNCHLCGTQVEKRETKGITGYTCYDCKLKRSREWARNKKKSKLEILSFQIPPLPPLRKYHHYHH